MKIYDQTITDTFAAYWGDCVHAMTGLPDESVGLCLYSVPFGDLFVYSDNVADLGNTANEAEFFEQYGHALREIHRLLKPGRLTAVHCTDLPSRKGRDGYIGVNPFSDKLLRAHLDAGFVLHCRVTIWRDPVCEMQRTKALGLLYKQLRKDSAMSRVGLSDYLLVFRRLGDNGDPVAHDERDFSLDQWQLWASPVWMDVRQGNVLNVRAARAAGDERHVCPLQLDLIERAVRLWSNAKDIVLSPFMGIGSEGYVALKAKRRFVGIELKETYYRQARKYLAEAEAEAKSGSLLDLMEAAE